MKKTFKFCFAFVLALSIFSPSVSASQEYIVNNKNSVSQINIDTKWWPGNPNPPVGTEDWLFQNYSYNFGLKAPNKIAERCGLNAVIGGVIGGTSYLFYNWWKGGPITVGMVFTKFGTSAASSFAGCLIDNGIRQ